MPALPQFTLKPSSEIALRAPTKDEVQSATISNCDRLSAFLEVHGYPYYSDLMLVARRESTCQSWVKNPITPAYSLYQIMPDTWSQYRCQGCRGNPTDETNCAVKIIESGGLYDNWLRWE